MSRVEVYDPEERVEVGPLGIELERAGVALNGAAEFLHTFVQQEGIIEVQVLEGKLARRYDLTEDQASHDVTLFLASAVTHGVSSYRPPKRTWRRVAVQLRHAPARTKAWLLGNRYESRLPRRRHMEPTMMRIIGLMAAMSFPKFLAVAVLLALLGGWFLFQGSFLQSSRSVAVTISLVACVLASALLAHLFHEAAHLITARRLGVVPRTVYYERGVVGVTRDSATPERNLLITILGPVAGVITTVFCGVAVALIFEDLGPLPLSRIEYLFLIVYALLPGMAQLSTLLPGTADGNSMVNDSLRWKVRS